MRSSMSLSGEKTSHKVTAVFETATEANAAAKELHEATSLSQDQITILGPGDKHPGQELEPEDKGIWATLVRAHIGLGIVGAIIGFLVFLLLNASGLPFIAQNTLIAGIVLSVLGLFCGLLLAGAFTLRPDHAPYLVKAQSALRRGKYVVAAHASSSEQRNEAQALLKKRGVKTVPTI